MPQNRFGIISARGNDKQMRPTIGPSTMNNIKIENDSSQVSFESSDFSKPDRFFREIVDFLKQRSNSSSEESKESPFPNKYIGGGKSPQSHQKDFQFSNLSFFKKGGKYSTISGTDAQILIFELLKIAFNENLVQSGPPAFKPVDINSFFGFLKYPSTIRNDAITAVGAPSSIAFIVKAIYWLYLFARIQNDFTISE